MRIRLTPRDVQRILAAARGVRENRADGVRLSDHIEVDIGSPLSDAIQERARFVIHRFDSEIYDRLDEERRRVAELLSDGHQALRAGVPRRAGDIFSRGFDLQERRIFRHAYSSSVIEGNALLREGINAMTTLICGGAETAYNNANAQLGVGDGGPVTLTGTLTFTQNSKTVTGSGTAFTTELVVGDWIRATTSTTYYRVSSIASDTSLTLERLFEDATESGVTGYRLDVGSTDLPGTVTWKGMDAGYPTFGSGQNMVFQSVFGGAEGNHAWKVFGVRNGATANKNMNMKFSDQGTKTSGQTWTLTLTIELM